MIRIQDVFDIPRRTLALAAALLTLAGGGGWFYHSQAGSMRQTAIENLASIGTAKANQIHDWRSERLADAAVLMDDPFLVDGIARFLDIPGSDTAAPLRTRFLALCKHHHVDSVMLVSPDGQSRLNLHADAEMYTGYDDALKSAIDQRAPVFTTLHTESGGKQAPHISVVTPIYKHAGDTNQPLAAIVMVHNAADFLFPLLASWPFPTRTAETALVTRDGDHAVFLNPLRHAPKLPFQLKIPLSRTDTPAVQALLGKKGAIEGRDYRGIEVVAFVMPIPDSPWFMVTKQDTAEILADWQLRSRLLLALFALLAGGLIAIGLLAWQRNLKRHFKALYISESRLHAEAQRHSVTLKAIGDAVISTDAAGRVDLLNPVAEAMTGWTEAEARGRQLEEVFRIISEDTRETAENPVEKVQRQGSVVGLANHTLLIDKSGNEHPIADSAAPIRNEQDEITGVVLVFRDQTTEQNYRMLFREMLDGFASHQIICDADGKPVDYRFLDVNPAFEKMTGLKAADIVGRTVLDVMPGTEPHWIETYGHVALTGEPAHFENFAAAIGRHFEVTAFRSVPKQFVTIFQDITKRKIMEERILQSHKMESVGRLAGGVAHDFNNILGVIMGNAEMVVDDLGAEHPNRAAIEEIINASQRAAAVTRQLLGFARRQTIAPKILDLNDTVEGLLNMLRRLIGENVDLRWRPSAKPLPVRMDPSQIDQLLVNLCINARDAIGSARGATGGTGCITIETDMKDLDNDYCADHPDAQPGPFVLLEVSDDGCGMDHETLKNLFEPFFTTKAVGKGTGLGLATLYGIIGQNKGFINVYSEPGKGSVFQIYLPRHAGDVKEGDATGGTPVKTAPASGKGETILIVEDNDSILKVSRIMLERLGYKVLVAPEPESALQLAETQGTCIDLLLTDVIMPGMNGRDLAARLSAAHPGLRTLFMSGYTSDVIGHHGVLASGMHFIQKPFSLQDLAATVQRILCG